MASLALAAMVGCGGSETAGTRDEAAVTRPAMASRGSAARSPARTATGSVMAPARPNPAAAAPEKTPSTAAQAPARQVPASAGTPRGEWRPDWWIDAPVQEGNAVRVAAMADDADLLEARRKAVSRGLSDLRATVDAAEGELLDAETTIDVISLPDGRYRAFVLVETGGQ
jgi:hypothetical protein